MFVCFDNFFYGQKKIPREGHSINDSKTTFGSALASFVTEIFHESQLFQLVTKANLAQYTKKCEDIFFLEPFYFVTIFLPRSFLKISEGHLQKMFEVEYHLSPQKQQNH